MQQTQFAKLQGNLVLAYFLKLWGPAWARKHIQHIVSASGPWAGAVKSIKGTVSGDNFGLPIPHNLLHSLQGIAPSGPWLFPSSDVWPPDAVVVRTNVRHYRAADLGSLLQVCCHFFAVSIETFCNIVDHLYVC